VKDKTFYKDCKTAHIAFICLKKYPFECTMILTVVQKKFYLVQNELLPSKANFDNIVLGVSGIVALIDVCR
jgi:hypothetical protein